MTEEQQDRPEDEKKEPSPVVPAAPTNANYRNLVQWLSDGKNAEWGLEKAKPILSALQWLGWVVALGSGAFGFLYSFAWAIFPAALALSNTLYCGWMAGVLKGSVDSDEGWKVYLKSFMWLSLGNVFFLPTLFALSLGGFGFSLVRVSETGWRLDCVLVSIGYLLIASMSIFATAFGLLSMSETGMLLLRRAISRYFEMTFDSAKVLHEQIRTTNAKTDMLSALVLSKSKDESN